LWIRAQSAMSAGGIMVNEFRRKVGLPDVSGGDVFLRNFNVVEVPLNAPESPCTRFGVRT
jgi:hypothetical protein